MTSFRALLQRSFGRVAALIAGVATLLVALQAALVIVAALQEDAQSFDLLAKLAPAFVQRQFGSSFGAFLSFAGLTAFGYFHPVVMLLFSVFGVFIATELAADVEGGQVDLLLSRPIARHTLVTRSVVLVLFVPLLLVSLMLAASATALRLFAPPGAAWPSAAMLGTMAAHLVGLSWSIGAVGLAVAAGAWRRANALGPVIITTIALYLLDLLAPAWRVLAPAAVVSPFHYFNGPAVLGGTADTARDLLVLGSITLIGVAAAYWRFARRDV